MRWLVSASTLPPATARLTLARMRVQLQPQRNPLKSIVSQGNNNSSRAYSDDGDGMQARIHPSTLHPCAHARESPEGLPLHLIEPVNSVWCAAWLTLDYPTGSRTTSNMRSELETHTPATNIFVPGASWSALKMPSTRPGTHLAPNNLVVDTSNSAHLSTITITILRSKNRRINPSSEKCHLNTGAGACVGYRRQWSYPQLHEALVGPTRGATSRAPRGRCMKT